MNTTNKSTTNYLESSTFLHFVIFLKNYNINKQLQGQLKTKIPKINNLRKQYKKKKNA